MAESEGTPRKASGPRHALPEDMEPAPIPAREPARPVGRPAPAYESYEAPESNMMPMIIAAILGGVLAAVLLLRARRRSGVGPEEG
ncbi:hypothetical protein [Tomitella fengzijianii]|uniref:Uncharacterized protein n=1 Tax=Tomitella fengzijianii TaxID=2597660 RepID=A0A516WZS6_9ACTN|nr:hypothetical protein [Tomitella fengzijianii]QDQ96313.1 hypothetical protein FO059_01825 [Tomitella fengzijianii]